MDFIDPKIEEYTVAHTEPESELLIEIQRVTHLKTTMPRMLSGHLQGRFLSWVSKWIQPRLIFEIGTFTGYSALCLAEGLPRGGRLITCEVDEEVAEIASQFFNRSPYSDQILSVVEDARTYLNQLQSPIDLAFIDGDKVQYPSYYEALFPHISQGGVIIVDNVLWSGKVVEKSSTDDETEALRSFANFVCRDDRVETLMLPLRDGLLLIRKK